MLREVTGEDASWAGRITETTRLDDELWLESIEVTALGERLRSRYGDRVDLPAYLAGCDLDDLIALTVGDLVTLAAEGRRA